METRCDDNGSFVVDFADSDVVCVGIGTADRRTRRARLDGGVG